MIIQTRRLANGSGRSLTGPGIERETLIEAHGVPPAFWDAFRRNHALFPRGIDVILTAGDRLAALPRTTRVSTGTPPLMA